MDHSWECVAELITGGYTDGIVCDVGLPVIHRGVYYNCRVILLNRKVGQKRRGGGPAGLARVRQVDCILKAQCKRTVSV